MLHRIREAMKTGTFVKLGGDSGPVEVDETFIGGNPQKMHKGRRLAISASERNSDWKCDHRFRKNPGHGNAGS